MTITLRTKIDILSCVDPHLLSRVEWEQTAETKTKKHYLSLIHFRTVLPFHCVCIGVTRSNSDMPLCRGQE